MISAADAAKVTNRNVREASLGANEVAHTAEELAISSSSMSHGVAEASSGSLESANNIQEVNQTIERTADSACNMNAASTVFIQMVKKMNSVASKFSV